MPRIPLPLSLTVRCVLADDAAKLFVSSHISLMVFRSFCQRSFPQTCDDRHTTAYVIEVHLCDSPEFNVEIVLGWISGPRDLRVIAPHMLESDQECAQAMNLRH